MSAMVSVIKIKFGAQVSFYVFSPKNETNFSEDDVTAK